MPIHRGIKLTVVSQMEFQVHPEFAHPESSQFTNRSPDLRRGPNPQFVEASPPLPSPSESKADRLLGRPSAVSVYIPSVPGVRFWLRYSIDEEAIQNSPWYYFKLFMNGRHIASWGTNSTTAPSGQVMRGLFEPTDKWNYRYEGTTFKCMGTETRPFYFAKEQEVRSAATDGGLLEVLIYRARGRKRKMPEPVDWKPQEQYGIVMPSSGLFESPQDAKYYDWLLKDPKDSPYGIFRFHYRSWDSLESLQLIPPTYPRKLLPSSASIISFNGLSRELQERLQESENEEGLSEVNIEADTRSSIDSQVSDTPWLTTVFDDTSDEVVKPRERREIFIAPPKMASLYPTQTQSANNDKLASAIVDKPALPEHGQWKEYLDRPLPEVPLRRSSLKHLRRHSRKTSSDSNAPSITPSLRSYMDRDTMSPEPELGIASVVTVKYHVSPVFDKYNLSNVEYSPSRYSSSPDRDDDEVRRPVISPSKLGTTPPPFLLPDITMRKTRNSPPKTPRTKVCSPPDSYSPRASDDHPTLIDNTTTLSMSESEWMCRTPSPLKQSLVLSGNASPITARKIDASEAGSLLGRSGHRKNTFSDGKSSLRKKAIGWYGKVRSDESIEGGGSGQLGNVFDPVEGKVRMGEMGGNWI